MEPCYFVVILILYWLYTNCDYVISGLALLKQHYYNLLKCLPDDYMTSLDKLKYLTTIKFKKQHVDDVKSCQSSQNANKKILDILILPLKAKHLIKFFDTIETLATSEMKKAVQAMKNGKFYVLVHIYLLKNSHSSCTKSASQSGSTTQDGQGEKVVKSRWRPRWSVYYKKL